MAVINLRDYYPFIHSDLFLEVSEVVAAALAAGSATIGGACSTTRRITRWTPGTALKTKPFSVLSRPVKFTSAS